MGGKAVFLDVDGTYVNHHGVVPASAHEAVVQARANGHRVFLCTGRSLAELWDDIMAAGYDGTIAAAGGYVEVGGQVLLHRSLPTEEVRRLVEFFDHRGVDYYLEANAGLFGSANCRERLADLAFGGVTDETVLAELEKGLGPFIDSIVLGEDLVRTDINKVSFLDSGVPLAEIQDEFAGRLTVIPTTVPQFGPNSGEISLPGITKAAAIELLLAHTGIARQDTIAFGDGLNDLKMFDYVHTGVAMASAHPRLLATADLITGAPDADGIRDGFRALGLI